MRKISLGTLKTKLDTLLDIENDTHISAAQKVACLNAGVARFYDFLIVSDLSDHLVKTATFTTVAGTWAYDLETIAPDFYKVRNVYVREDTNQYRPLPSVNEWYLQSHRPPDASHTIRLDYIPCAPALADNADEVDGVNGWEELIVAYAALELLQRRQEESGWVASKIRETEERITKMAYRDAGYPDHIIRRRLRDPYGIYSRQNVDGYRLRGGNIEVYRRDGYLLPV